MLTSRMFITIAAFSATALMSEARGLRPLFPPAEAYPTVAGCTGARDTLNSSDDCTAYRVRLSKLGAACVPADPSALARTVCIADSRAVYGRIATKCGGQARYLTCARNAGRVAKTN